MRCTHDEFADCPACGEAQSAIENARRGIPAATAHEEAIWEDREYARGER